MRVWPVVSVAERLFLCAVFAPLLRGDAPVAEVSAAFRHDLSPPLWSISGPAALSANARDAAVQYGRAPGFGINFAGIGHGDYGFSVRDVPPDPNGAVGATQYVQFVNRDFAVFDKSTGAIAPGFPKPGNAPWQGFGGACETTNDGDPIVQYDKAAQRWILTQVSVTGGPILQCVAVSATPDATGAYYRYAFAYGDRYVPDYAKLAVWRDAYYLSANMYDPANGFVGPRVCAYERRAMLGGFPARQQCLQLSSSYGSLLPSDLDGATPPPFGSPNFLVSLAQSSLMLWRFRVDWFSPDRTSITGPFQIPVAGFTRACAGTGCISQPGTSQLLDAMGDRLMYRLAYRNFGTHESLVVNHSIAVGPGANPPVGVRWYEIRQPNQTPALYQQGTHFAGDGISRWMGSIAMDRKGNMLLGYSASGSGVHPSIRLTGRLASDPSGAMRGEYVLQRGYGSQTENVSRWGDYTAMTVDPADDCTFWYTNQYLKSNGAFNWSTRIASYQFPGCR